MLSITLPRPPTLSSVTRGETVTHAAQALGPTFEPVASSDGEALGAVVGGAQVWARAISGAVRLAAVHGAVELRVCVNGAPVAPETATANGLSFTATGLDERRAHTVAVQVRGLTDGTTLSGTTTLSVTATDWGADALPTPEDRAPDEDDE